MTEIEKEAEEAAKVYFKSRPDISVGEVRDYKNAYILGHTVASEKKKAQKSDKAKASK